MQEKLAALGIGTVGQLRQRPLELEARFGRWGSRLHELAQGIIGKSRLIDLTTTFAVVRGHLRHRHPLEAGRQDPQLGGRSESPPNATSVSPTPSCEAQDPRFPHPHPQPPPAPSSAAELIDIALRLRGTYALPSSTRYRLVGVGLGSFTDADDPRLRAGLFDLRRGQAFLGAAVCSVIAPSSQPALPAKRRRQPNGRADD